MQFVFDHCLYGFPAGAQVFARVEFAGLFRKDLAYLGSQRHSQIGVYIHFAYRHFCGLADGRFPASADAQGAFFEKHVSPWMARLFADLENAARAKFYRSVGALGRTFLEIEAEALTLTN